MSGIFNKEITYDLSNSSYNRSHSDTSISKYKNLQTLAALGYNISGKH